MNYKSMVLIALLFPVFCHSQTKVDHSKKLKKLQFKKLLKLKEIEKQIADLYKLVDYCRDNYTTQMNYTLEKKLRALKNSDEEHTKQSIESENESIAKHLYQAIRDGRIFDYDLTQELFVPEVGLGTNDFDTLKFFFIQMATGRALLDHLVVYYQECLHELLSISQKLASLKQEG